MQMCVLVFMCTNVCVHAFVCAHASAGVCTLNLAPASRAAVPRNAAHSGWQAGTSVGIWQGVG